MIVKGFKDITGQEFLAEVISEGDIYTIKNPTCLVPTENGITPIPYIMTTRDELRIHVSKLLFEPFDPIENIVDSYKKMYGGIIEPTSKIIL